MKGKRTIILNAIAAVLGVLEAIEWTELIGSKAGIVMAILSIANMVLRFFTDTPVFQKSIGGGGIDTGKPKG